MIEKYGKFIKWCNLSMLTEVPNKGKIDPYKHINMIENYVQLNLKCYKNSENV